MLEAELSNPRVRTTSSHASPQASGGAILMHDVGDALLTAGDHVIPLDQHLRFLALLAQLHGAFWGGPIPPSTRSF